MSANHIKGLVAFLRADVGVAAFAGSRVFGPDGVPTAQNASMPQAAIVVSAAGGMGAIGNAYQRYSDKRVDVACFGRTQTASLDLHLVVFRALKDLRRATVNVTASEQMVIHWARISSDGTTGIDPQNEWPMTLSSWQVLVSEVPISV